MLEASAQITDGLKLAAVNIKKGYVIKKKTFG